MSASPPELKAILEQVEAELSAMLLAGEIGSVTVHCGRGDLYVEAVSKRKHDAVLIQQERRLAVIRKAR